MRKKVVAASTVLVLVLGHLCFTRIADACIDGNALSVGKARVIVKQKTSSLATLQICYRVQWNHTKTDGLKFQGFRIPRAFTVQPGNHQLLFMTGGEAFVDQPHSIVVHQKNNAWNCFSVTAHGYFAHLYTGSVSKRVYRDAATVAAWLKLELTVKYNRHYLQSVFRKGKNAGATLGQFRLPDDPVPKSPNNCGPRDPQWKATAKKRTPPPPRARASDF